jgi:hypothetical protein
MRHRSVGTWALALALSVGTANHAHGQLPAASQGGIFTRYFKRPASAARAEKEDHSIPEVSAAARLAQAQADWMRRQEVCLKLRNIAVEAADDDLWRKADQLEQRAWDAFVQQTSSGGTAAADEARLRQHLPSSDSSEASARLLRPASTTARGQKDAGQAALGGER